MAFQSRARFRPRVKRAKKHGVWVNIPFGNVNFTETVGNQVLLVPEDWEASFTGLSLERASLRAIVGQLHIVQTTAGTRGGDMFWGIYMRGQSETAVPTFTTSGMSTNVWLWTGSRATSSVVTDGLQMVQIYCAQEPIAIKVKRALSSSIQICIAAQFGADAASPAGILGGLLRFYIVRD